MTSVNIVELESYLLTALGMTKAEFNTMIGPTFDMVTVGSDCKIALSHAIKANRMLSQMKAALKAKKANKAMVETTEKDNVREMIFRYRLELDRGCFPLCDKELVLTDFTKYAQAKASNWGDIIGDCKTATEKKAKMKNLPDLWKTFEDRKIDSDDKISFTSVNITEITDCDITGATDTMIKAIVESVARKRANEQMKGIEAAADAVSELLEGVRKEILALGSSAQVISSENYGMNRTAKVE